MACRIGKKMCVFSFAVAVLLIASGQIAAGEITTSVSFSTTDLMFETLEEYDVVKLARCDITREVGEPQLPVKLVHVALPAGAEMDRVEIVSADTEELAGTFRIYPVQPPQPYGIPGKTVVEAAFVSPKATIYESAAPYPQAIAQGMRAGSMAGYRLAGVRVYPIQYNPTEGTLQFHRHIELRIHYTAAKGDYRLLNSQPQRAHDMMRQRVERLVLNPEDVTRRVGLRGDVISAVPSGYYEYVIITDEIYESAFGPLVDWKTKKGVPATIVTTAWVYANYSGLDNQEQIRNFIRDAYEQWGTIWVLLGGDSNDKTDVDDPGPGGEARQGTGGTVAETGAHGQYGIRFADSGVGIHPPVVSHEA